MIHEYLRTNSEILKIMKYTMCRANVVYDVMYGHGIFIPRSERIKARQAGFDTCVFCQQNIGGCSKGVV